MIVVHWWTIGIGLIGSFEKRGFTFDRFKLSPTNGNGAQLFSMIAHNIVMIGHFWPSRFVDILL